MHRALLRLLFGAVRDDDPADLLFAFVEAVNDDAVVQWSNVHDFQTPDRASEGSGSGSLATVTGVL